MQSGPATSYLAAGLQIYRTRSGFRPAGSVHVAHAAAARHCRGAAALGLGLLGDHGLGGQQEARDGRGVLRRVSVT